MYGNDGKPAWGNGGDDSHVYSVLVRHRQEVSPEESPELIVDGLLSMPSANSGALFG